MTDDTDNARCECGRFVPCRHCTQRLTAEDVILGAPEQAEKFEIRRTT